MKTLYVERNASLSPHLDETRLASFCGERSEGRGLWRDCRCSGVLRECARRVRSAGAWKDLSAPLEEGRVRRRGGGRKPLIEIEPKLPDDLNALVEPAARGDPMSPLRWTSKSLRKLATELRELGHKISHTLVGELLKRLGFSLQANRKTREGDSHPDRDAQFCYINAQVAAALAENEPVISVDTKKKELVGDFKNAGREWRPEAHESPSSNGPDFGTIGPLDSRIRWTKWQLGMARPHQRLSKNQILVPPDSA